MYSNFGTFYNNTSSSDICIRLWSYTGYIQKSNFINNHIPLYGVVHVTDSGVLSLNESIFHNNFNILLYVYSGSLKLFNCFSDKIYLTQGAISNTLIISYTNQFIHNGYITFYCSGKNTIYLTISKNFNIKILFLIEFFLF